MKGQISLVREDFALDCKFNLENEITGVFGASGCGKTTLLRCIAGLEKKTSGKLKNKGSIWLDSEKNISLAPHKRAIAYVFQDARLFSHLSVKQNLLFSSTNNQHSELGVIIELFNLAHLIDKKPAQLSGGEQQRVAIGRALMSQPEVLLMDEPLSALDEQHKLEIIPYIEKIRKKFNIPILYVSHSLSEISLLSDTLLLMEKGKIIAQGKTEEILTDLNHPLADLTDAISIVTGEVLSHDAEHHLVKINSDIGALLIPGNSIAKGKKLKLKIQAKDVSLSLEKSDNSSIINILPATIIAIDDTQACHVNIQLQLNNHFLLSRISHLSLKKLKLVVNKNIYIQIKGIAMKELN